MPIFSWAMHGFPHQGACGARIQTRSCLPGMMTGCAWSLADEGRSRVGLDFYLISQSLLTGP